MGPMGRAVMGPCGHSLPTHLLHQLFATCCTMGRLELVEASYVSQANSTRLLRVLSCPIRTYEEQFVDCHLSL